MELAVGTTVGAYVLGATGEVDALEDMTDGAVTDMAAWNGSVWFVRDGRLDAGRASHPLPDGHRATCLLAAGERLLVGADRARLFSFDGDTFEPLTGFDRAPGRDDWYTPWGGPPDVRSLASADGATLVNVHVGGVLRSVDGGSSWEPTIDPDTDVHEVIAAAGQVFAALGAGGLAWSADGAHTWTTITVGLHATYCRAVARAGEQILVSASTGPGGGRSAIYRGRPDRGDPLERCVDGLPEWFDANIDTRCLQADGDVGLVGTRLGEIYRSDDAGRTWTLLADGLPAIRCLRLVSPAATGS